MTGVGFVNGITAWLRGMLIGLAVSALMLAGISPVQAETGVTALHVFLAAGQSNMSGRGLPAGGSRDPVNPRIFQYGAKNPTLRAATVPLDMLDSPSGISPATTFAREYLSTQPTNVGVLIIPAAHGSTGFTSATSTRTWTVGAASSPQYDLPSLAVKQTLAGISAARAAGYAVVLKGVLWHQGENNSSMSTSTYSAKLDQLIASFRSRLSASNLPFVVGRMAPEGIAATPGRENVDRAHSETPGRVPRTGFAPSMAGALNGGDTSHFNRTGIEYLGKTYLSAYMRAAGITPGTLTAAVPTISGVAKVGSTLTAVPGTWGPSPLTLSYQWYRSYIAISGATGAKYTPGGSELDRTITVKVTGSKPGYTTTSRTSAGLKITTPGTLTAAVPTISGVAKVGSTLTAVPGTWGPSPVTLSYQWYRSHIAISGATGYTYKPVAGDYDRTITVKVTGSKPGYTTTSRTSAGVKIAR
ncbi:sialate O-acetylesterase [Pseudarthrobacter sp. PvP090]|uniref:sialate O-acetylesterase n=1 Tax=Pseudarthrobacter sp. PvP090 TaxID=3156393 RepID=UPI0033943D72